ncbi:hypothetical protein [Paraburkholderia sediminicola]|uniref:hypothetical protein n=1 Tax=Paraburkholderia sediminicola TaxID=458836 RepID=UPI0038B71F36
MIVPDKESREAVEHAAGILQREFIFRNRRAFYEALALVIGPMLCYEHGLSVLMGGTEDVARLVGRTLKSGDGARPYRESYLNDVAGRVADFIAKMPKGHWPQGHAFHG